MGLPINEMLLTCRKIWLFAYFGTSNALPSPPAPTDICKALSTISASLNPESSNNLNTGIVVVISKDPICVGLDLLIFLAEIAREVFVLLPFKRYSSMLIWTTLIESDLKSLGISSRGIEALMPEAFGSCCSTRDAIFEEMTFSVVIAPPPRSIPIPAIEMRATDFCLI